MRAWLRSYATRHPCHGFRRAWATLRHDERREVNKKKIHRLWREEGLQVRTHSPRKRAGVSSIPPIAADAPNVVWASDFQFDSTVDGKAIKIASMIDEHTRCSLLHLAERSITAQCLVAELESVFAMAGGSPKVLRMDNGPELVSQALQQFCENKVGLSYIPPAIPWNNGYIESFNNRLRKECLNRNHWNTLLEARVVIGDFKHEHNRRHRHSAPGLSNAGRVRCGLQAHPHPGGLRDRLNLQRNNPKSVLRGHLSRESLGHDFSVFHDEGVGADFEEIVCCLGFPHDVGGVIVHLLLEQIERHPWLLEFLNNVP
jgi:putative transposase